MANVQEIREKLAQLLFEEISLDQFEDWFVLYSWNVHKSGDDQAQRFAYALEGQLSQFDEDSPGLRRALMEVAIAHLPGPVSAENSFGDSPLPESSTALQESTAVLV